MLVVVLFLWRRILGLSVMLLNGVLLDSLWLRGSSDRLISFSIKVCSSAVMGNVVVVVDVCAGRTALAVAGLLVLDLSVVVPFLRDVRRSSRVAWLRR